MKKTLALILALVCCFSLVLTACGGMVGTDLGNGLNKDLVDVDGQRYG